MELYRHSHISLHIVHRNTLILTLHQPNEEQEHHTQNFCCSCGAPTAKDLTFSRLDIYIYICRTAPLTSRRCILYISSTNIRTEYFKHAAHSPFFPLQNAVYFIMLPFFLFLYYSHFKYRVC
jgi:hypothetical protein